MRRLTPLVPLALLALASPALAEVTVLGWPGGPEEAALRAAAEAYNATANLAGDDRVELPGGAAPTPQGLDGTATLDAVAWAALDDEATWPAGVADDRFLAPQLRRIRAHAG